MSRIIKQITEFNMNEIGTNRELENYYREVGQIVAQAMDQGLSARTEFSGVSRFIIVWDDDITDGDLDA